jgi:taurine dioxygenase
MTIATADATVDTSANLATDSSARSLQDFEIRPLGAALGAEVIGVDLGRPLSHGDFQRIHQAHLDHHVLVFRDQRITPAQQIAFSRRFGPLQIHVLNQFQLAGPPEVLIVSNVIENGKPIGLGDAGHFWHSDLSYKEHRAWFPAARAGTARRRRRHAVRQHAHRVGEPAGGAAAQGGRSHRRAHVSGAVRGAAGAQPVASEPDAGADRAGQARGASGGRTHPETGASALFVSEHFTTRIVGLPDDESRAMLEELFAHSVQPSVYRHQWREHDLVFWDNRSLLHLAAGTPDQLRRVMYRTTIEGDRRSDPVPVFTPAPFFRSPLHVAVSSASTLTRRAAVAMLTAGLA